MSINHKAVEVGANSTRVDAQEAIRANSQKVAEAKVVEVVAQEEVREVESKKIEAKSKTPEPTSITPSEKSSNEPAQGRTKAPGDTDAGFIADVGLEALGGSAAKMAKTLYDVVTDGDPGSFGGIQTMEDMISGVTKPSEASAEITEDIMGEKVRSIDTGYSNDVAARATNVSDSIAGEDKIKGATANQTCVAALQSRMVSQLHLGLAQTKDRELSLGQREAELAGAAPAAVANSPAPGGGMASLNLNNYAPSPPTGKIHDEADAAGTA